VGPSRPKARPDAEVTASATLAPAPTSAATTSRRNGPRTGSAAPTFSLRLITCSVGLPTPNPKTVLTVQATNSPPNASFESTRLPTITSKVAEAPIPTKPTVAGRAPPRRRQMGRLTSRGSSHRPRESRAARQASATSPGAADAGNLD
jgi:hypothetical protein